MLLYTGRFTEVKRLPLLIEAFARARPRFRTRTALVLLGGYPGEWEGEHPIETIERLGLSDVFLAGWHSHEELPDFINAADLLVHASVKEQFGQVLVEAMACGLPVIASTAAARRRSSTIPIPAGWFLPTTSTPWPRRWWRRSTTPPAGGLRGRSARERGRRTATPGGGSASTSPGWRASCPGSRASGGSKKDRAGEGRAMSEILIGPLLRYVSETEATVWVETDEACEVEVLGHSERTFGVAGHHYALVRIEGLEPGGFYEYEVALDGERRWPAEGSELPPSAIRTLGSGKPLDICFGSCRVALPHEHPYTEAADEHEEGFELDALHVLARQMIRDDRDDWPELLFLLGDQVYVDEGSPQTRERIRAKRDTSKPPGEEVIDFEEYTWLYSESWRDPLVRWLFSTVSLSMVWDDHDMSDDWNISRSWHDEMDRKEWWHERAVARDHDLLDLPAARQPLAPRARRERALRQGPRQSRRDRRAARVGQGDRLHRVRQPLELLPRHRRSAGDLHGLPRVAGS